jgi:beta-glucosidase
VEQTVEWRNRVQEYMRTKTRLGIPIIFIDEAHHGLLQKDVDIFPHGIGLSCSWDPALLEAVYAYIGDQARSRGTTLVLSPVVDVTRDPRWGRTGETHGEDPYLCGVLGAAAVRGFQGSATGSVGKDRVAATLKHFSGHGQSESGVNQGPSNYSERVLREFHMESVRMCIERAKPAAIMPSYCEIDGIPSHANAWLLKQVLRDEWGYDGIVVSDWWAIDQLWQKHGVEPDQLHAAQRSFNAGVTVDLPEGTNYAHLTQLVKDGGVKLSQVDAAVGAVLTLKFRLGLFEEGPIDLSLARKRSAREEGRVLARQAAERSMVLLKNENDLLPLRLSKLQRIAVIGPCAATNYLGDYSGIPAKNVTPLEGIKAKVGDGCEVLYAPGCRLSKKADPVRYSNYQNAGPLELPSAEENRQLIATAAKVAQRADVVICAVGESEQFSQEAGSRAPGDMSDLGLQSHQEELVRALVATGTPVVVYLMHGRPFAIPWIADHVEALVDGWFAGEQAGHALANILFGDANPSGKLTISYPRSVGQLPIYYNHKPTARAFDYVNEKSKPLFPFGHGLSYTTFTYSSPRLRDARIKAGATTAVEIDVTNTGPVAGDEIVQLYIHQKVSSATRPVKELKDFARISLKPGERHTVKFAIDGSKLSYWNAAMKYGVEAGVFEVMVGRSSVDLQKVELTVE